MRIAVVGTGGVGGYFGGRLAQAGAETHFVARGAHLDALRARGLRLRSDLGDADVEVAAHADAADIGPCDVVLFAVKSYDTEAAAAEHLPALVGEDTMVVTLQNGVDNTAKLAEAVGDRRVVGGLALIFAWVEQPGVVVHRGPNARVVFGELDGSASARTAALLRTFQDASVDAVLTTHVRSAMWDKYAFICAVAGLTAATRLPLGEVRGSEPAWALFRQVVEEVYAVARAEGVPVADDAVDRRVEIAAGLEPGSYSSLHHDLVNGRRLEIEALHGHVAALGRAHGVPTPACATIYALLHPHARAADASSRGKVTPEP